MRVMRLYAPVIVIAVWSILLFAVRLNHEIRAVAWMTIAYAFKLQVDEFRRQQRDRRDGP